MKQSVNLYLPEFRKRKEWLTSSRMLLIFSAAIGLLVFASGVEIWRYVGKKEELADIQSQHTALVAATENLRSSFGTQLPDEKLQGQIKQLEQALQNKQAILKFMDGKDFGNASGFSEYLADLSRYYMQGLSLTEIKLTEGGRSVTLSGQVTKADVVPLYLQSLSKGKSYTGKNFRTLQINQGKNPTGTAKAGIDPRAWLFTVSTNK